MALYLYWKAEAQVLQSSLQVSNFIPSTRDPMLRSNAAETLLTEIDGFETVLAGCPMQLQ